MKKVFNFLKWLCKEFGEMGELHHRMEMGNVKCLRCGHDAMEVVDTGIMPKGICGNCKFEM
jgi:hypothetical protein